MSDILLGNRAVLVAANHAIQAAERVEELRRELAQAESFLVARRCEVVDELDALRACDPDAWPAPGLTSLQMGEWRVDIQPRYYDCTQKFGGVEVSKIVPEQLTNIGEAIAQIDRQVARSCGRTGRRLTVAAIPSRRKRVPVRGTLDRTTQSLAAAATPNFARLRLPEPDSS